MPENPTIVLEPLDRLRITLAVNEAVDTSQLCHYAAHRAQFAAPASSSSETV